MKDSTKIYLGIIILAILMIILQQMTIRNLKTGSEMKTTRFKEPFKDLKELEQHRKAQEKKWEGCKVFYSYTEKC